MRAWGAAGLGALIGCASPSSVFICSEDGQCEGGRCEVNGFCSFPSQDCASGWAYGELSSPMLAGNCVGEGMGVTSSTTDAMPSTTDAPPVTSDGSGVTSSAMDSSGEPPTTGYGETGYGPSADCDDYAALIAYCYGEQYYGEAIERCYGFLQLYYEGNYACVYAYEEFLACLSPLDCEQFAAGACDEIAAEVAELCPGF